MTPHEKATAVIEALTNEELAELSLCQVMELAMPYGVAVEVADNMGLPPRTVQSWRVDPDLVTGSLKATDPVGRRGDPHQSTQFLLALNGVFPPGAHLFHRWQGLKLAKGQAIQGRKRMEAVLQLADEARAIEEEAQALEAKARAFREKIAALPNTEKT